MKNLKKLTILHSNDLHGDFLAEEIDEKLIGGVGMLSGYVNKVRREEKNVIYAIAGDMFRGSIIDSEYRGISTIQIMNLIDPDIVTVGNHEVDYGISQLLFLEKCADFPIINANMHISTNNVRLFKPYHIFEMDGMKILFIGILTEETLQACKSEGLLGTLIDIEDAAEETGRICNAYRSTDIDLTVLLTHIGFDQDKKLAELLDPAWGVDLIIGGHSHTLPDKPEIVNGIPIVQAGIGTDQIGRFDIMIDTDNNCIDSFTWKTIPIDSTHCPVNTDLEEVIRTFKKCTDRKYNQILTTLARKLTHPVRNRETSLGIFIADAMKTALNIDIFLMGSGAIRSQELGPIVTLRDLKACLPYEDQIHLLRVTGKQLRQMMLHILRDEAFIDENHTEFFQLSRGLKVEYLQKGHRLLQFRYNGTEITDNQVFTLGLAHFHYLNTITSLGIPIEELRANGADRVISTSTMQIIEEFLISGKRQDVKDSGRLILHLDKDQ